MLAPQVQHWSAELAQARVLQRAADATASGGDGAVGGAAASAAVGGMAVPGLALADDADAVLVSAAKRSRVLSQFDDLQACYLRAHVQHAAAAAVGGGTDSGDGSLVAAASGAEACSAAGGGLTPLDDFVHTLSEFTRYRCVRWNATPAGSKLHGCALTCHLRAQPLARRG